MPTISRRSEFETFEDPIFDCSVAECNRLHDDDHGMRFKKRSKRTRKHITNTNDFLVPTRKNPEFDRKLWIVSNM
jgi:hypothetical protein